MIQSNNPLHILIADDEPLARARLKALVEELGPPWRVVAEASNGQQTLERCQHLRPHLVLLDISMPGLDGLETGRRLAAQTDPPAVIFVTAHAEHALEAYSAYPAGYLLKPVRKAALAHSLRHAAGLSRAQRSALAGNRPILLARTGREALRIPLEEVILLRAEDKYVTVIHQGGEALSDESLKALEQRLGEQVIRLHRNTLAPVRRLQGLQRTVTGSAQVRLAGWPELLPVSRTHLPTLRRRLGEN